MLDVGPFDIVELLFRWLIFSEGGLVEQIPELL
jgi:hypothetical protein